MAMTWDPSSNAVLLLLIYLMLLRSSIMSSLSRYALSGCALACASFLSPNIAVALEETNLAAQPATTLPQETKTEAAPALAAGQVAAPVVESKTFVSVGQPMSLDNLGLTVTPPKGWEVSTNTGSLSVVMREPRDPAPNYEKPKYQRNITMAAIHQASPIDEKRAADLCEQLIKTFSADSLVSNFQIQEHKFFNYRGQNDGLLVYSTLNIGEYPMMQMHVLVSGKDKQFLMTYTDLADQFNSPASFEGAWNSIVTAEVTGETPLRSAEYARYAATLAGFLMLGMVGLLLRRRANKVDYASDADEYLEDGDGAATSMFATLAEGWKIAKGGDAEEISGIEFTGHAPMTRKTEYVSNY